VKRASPESITTIGSMDSGPAHPSRLLPTWTMTLPNSGKPEFGGASQNDELKRARREMTHQHCSSALQFRIRPHRYQNACSGAIRQRNLPIRPSQDCVNSGQAPPPPDICASFVAAETGTQTAPDGFKGMLRRFAKAQRVKRVFRRKPVPDSIRDGPVRAGKTRQSGIRKPRSGSTGTEPRMASTRSNRCVNT